MLHKFQDIGKLANRRLKIVAEHVNNYEMLVFMVKFPITRSIKTVKGISEVENNGPIQISLVQISALDASTKTRIFSP